MHQDEQGATLCKAIQDLDDTSCVIFFRDISPLHTRKKIRHRGLKIASSKMVIIPQLTAQDTFALEEPL